MKTNIFLLGAVVALFIALAAFVASAFAQTSTMDVVQIENGMVAATRDSTADLHVYKMIPFAAPPVGELRCKPPQPAASWQGVRRADYFSPRCMQPNMSKSSVLYTREEVASEDCLYLNVWTPAKSNAEKLPVMVWIYGGSNIIGSASEPMYEGAALAKKGVVLVTFNYRVGVFGFFAHPELSKEPNANNSSGNYAALDQIAALKWVQKNIAAFGGDPNNVTLFGESSGSNSACRLTASPLAKGLFHRVVGESTSCFYGGQIGGASKLKLADAEQAGSDWAKRYFTATTVAEMRAKPAWDLLGKGSLTTSFIDGYVLPDFPDNIYANGQQNDVPILVGWNKDEGTIFAPMATRVVSYTAAAQTRYGKSADQFLKVYPATTDAETLAQSYAAGRDILGRGMWAWARAHDKTGKTKSYIYYWNYEPPWLPGVKFSEMDPATKLGAYHESEINYVFQTLNVWATMRQYTEADTKLADLVSSYWVNFAKTGDPNGPGLPPWSPFDNQAANPVMYLGTQAQAGPLPNKAGLDFMDTHWSSMFSAP